MEFDCRFAYRPQPFEPDDYLREMTVDVSCFVDSDEDDVEPVLAARMGVDHLELGRALAAGQRIYDVCDADSSGWESVYSSLFEPGTQAEWRSDFDFDEPINDLLFMHNSVFHPALRDWQAFIIDHVATLVGHDSAFVMWRDQTTISDSELAALGFRIVAGSGLLIRNNMFKRDYSAADDERDVLDACVPADAEKYVKSNWKFGPVDRDSIMQAVFKEHTGSTLTVVGEIATVWTPYGSPSVMYHATRKDGEVVLKEYPVPTNEGE